MTRTFTPAWCRSRRRIHRHQFPVLRQRMLRRRRSQRTRVSSATLAIPSVGRQPKNGPSFPARPPVTSWASTHRTRFPCFQPWPAALRSAITGLVPCPPRLCPIVPLMPATSQGHMDDTTRSFTGPTIFGALTAQNIPWMIYGYETDPLTRVTFSDTTNAPDGNFGVFANFKTAAADGELPAFTFLEPSSGSKVNSHIRTTCSARRAADPRCLLRPAQRSCVERTLLIITYDEHGGCYDHVPPPWVLSLRIIPPANLDSISNALARVCRPCLFRRGFAKGTVFRVPAKVMPFDHTSILKTLENRWSCRR